MEPRAGGGGAVGKDSLKDEYNSVGCCHRDSTFLVWVNVPSSVDITGDIQPVFAYLAPPFLRSPHRTHLLQLESTGDFVTIISVYLAFIHQIFIEHLLCAGQCCR